MPDSCEPTAEEVNAATRVFIGIVWPHTVTVDDIGSATMERIRTAMRESLRAANFVRIKNTTPVNDNG